MQLEISPSDRKDKKFKAVFYEDGVKIKTTHFGAKGMDDYTLTKDTDQRARYRARHLKDLASRDPTKAGFLSYFILWGEHTDIRRNINDYKKNFGFT